MGPISILPLLFCDGFSIVNGKIIYRMVLACIAPGLANWRKIENAKVFNVVAGIGNILFFYEFLRLRN